MKHGHSYPNGCDFFAILVDLLNLIVIGYGE